MCMENQFLAFDLTAPNNNGNAKNRDVFGMRDVIL